MAALDGAVGQEELAAAAVYRASGHSHRDAGAQVRRQLLALDAARYGNRELARGLTELPARQEEPGTWTVQWATGTGLDSRLRYALPAPAKVTVVATVVVEDRGLAVAGCEDGTLHWWDPATGQKLGHTATGHTRGVRDLVTAVLDGRPVAVTCGSDGAVLVWDLADGAPVSEYHAGGDGRVISLATAPLDGRPAVVAGCTDGVLRVWHLAAPTPGGEPLTIRTGNVQALATAVVDGRPIAVTGHAEGAVRRWDLITGREYHLLGDDAEDSRPVTDPVPDRPTATDGADTDDDHGHDGDSGDDGGMRRCVTMEINAMTHLLATDPTFECPVAISANAYATYVWNLATGEQVSEPGPGFAEAAALTMLHGRPTAVLGFGLRGPVAVWDLSAHRHVRPPLTGHQETVRTVATAVVQGRHLAVTGGDDRSVRIWNLDGEKEADSRPAGHAGPVQQVTTAVVDGRPVIVTGGTDTNVRLWDLDGGEQLGEPLTGHTAAVNLLTAGTVQGRPTLVTRDRHETVRIWDLISREELHGHATSEYTSPSIRFFAAVDGHFVAVTSEGRVWDLAAHAWIGVRPEQGGALALETVEGRHLILTGHGTETVQLWDVATGEQTAPPMTAHTGRVSAGAVGMLNGHLAVAAGTGNGTVHMWHGTTGRQIGTYAFPAPINTLAAAPNGQLVVGFGPDIAVLTHH